VIIAKHRNGALETVSLKFVKDFAKFENLDKGYGDTMDQAENPDFDRFKTITMQSRMNDKDDSDFFSKENEDAPF